MDVYTVGELELRVVLDAHDDIEGARVFYPATEEQWSPGLEVEAEGNLAVQVPGLLVKGQEGYTLIDTGFGEEEHSDRPFNMLSSLREVGVQPKDISRVILTHAHGDHCLGNTLLRGGRWLPAFPLAEYVIQEKEIAEMREVGDPVWATRFRPLDERGQLRLISGETDLGGGIVCWPTPGHTQGHQSVLMESGGQAALFCGDLAVLTGNIERPGWGPSWAWSREQDIANRRRIAEWAVDTGAMLIIGHDPERTFVHLSRQGNGYQATVVPPA